VGTYNPEWKQLRREILERDDFTCRFCGRGGRFSDYLLEVHHIIWRRHGGQDQPSNLMTICVECHDKLHYGKWKGRPRTFTELKDNQGKRW